jgi:hypothetical protein
VNETGTIALRCVTTVRAELLALYASVLDVSEREVDQVLEQFATCEDELLVELKARPLAIHELLLPDSGSDSDSDSGSESNSGADADIDTDTDTDTDSLTTAAHEPGHGE